VAARLGVVEWPLAGQAWPAAGACPSHALARRSTAGERMACAWHGRWQPVGDSMAERSLPASYLIHRPPAGQEEIDVGALEHRNDALEDLTGDGTVT
jgi:hypothetical protein